METSTQARPQAFIPTCIESLEARRLLSAGALDTTFGTGGKVVADAGNAYDSANAVAVQSDGKIVVAGFGDTFTVIRYNTDGTVDSTFTPPASLAGGSNEFDAITILSDGKILLAGDGYNAAAGEWDIRVTRLNSNGTYDSSFGNLGTRYVDIGGSETAFDVALQTDGKIVLTGQTFGTSWNAFTARLSANGSIDTTFAGTGYVVTDFGTTNQEWANALVIQTDGKILIGGTSDDGSKDHMAMARFNTNGTYDTSFIGGTGIYVFPVVSTFGGESIKDMVLLPDGKILTGGVGGAIDFMIARFNTNGSLDTSFATSGRKTLNVGPSNDRIETLAVRSDGRIIAGGWRYSSSTGNYDWALVEFLSDGTPASDFGTGGIVTTDFGTNWDQGNALVQTSSGIVMAGTAGSANVNGNFALARYADTPIYGSITGTIFNDDNNNAVQDGSEGLFGTAGTAFIDANNNGAYDTGEPLGTTAAAGNFRFASLLPGTYAIRMRFTSPVNTYTVTTPALNVTLVEGQNMTNAGPIGVYTVYAVGGQAFADFDQDGVLDSDETLLTGRTIYVDYNDNGSLDSGEQSGVTDSKGAWTLKLPKGTYRLRQVVPGNWQETGRSTSVAVSGSTFAADGAVRVPTDSVSNLLRFGSQSVTLSRVAGFVVRDTNGNGVKDTGEATLTPGDVVYIDANNNGSLDTGETSFTTNVDGWYFYLQPGTYVIRQQLPSGWQQTAPTGNAGFTVNVVAGTQLYGPYYFLRYLPNNGSISGKVFKDIDRDGILDSDEVGATQQNVYIDANNNGTWESTETYANLDANGNWSFTGLLAGTYTLRLLTNTGWGQSAPANNGAVTVTLAADQAKTGVLFGAVDYRPGYVGGYVFNDTNNNGVRDSGETGLSGVYVYWDTERNGKLDPIPSNDTVAQTNASGYWSMSLVEYNRQTYRFAFYNQTGRSLTTPALGYYEVSPIAGQTVTDYDFGLRVAPVGAAISGTVYNDANGNKLKDTGENGIAGITVYNDANNNSKLDASELTTTTDASGMYVFSGLLSGSYKIRQILQTGWTQTTPTNNYGHTITLATNQQLAGKDFGTKAPVQVTPGAISGTIFSDLNHNGVKDAGEGLWTLYGLGVYLDLNNNNKPDSVEPTTNTAETGQYSFSNLTPGAYVVRLDPMLGNVRQTLPVAGAGANVTVASGQTATAGAFGVAQVSDVYVDVYNDANGDGTVQFGSEGPIAGRTIYADLNNNSVFDSGEPSLSTAGGATYMQLFTGDYTLRQILPAGNVQTGRMVTYPVDGSQFAASGLVRIPTDLLIGAASAPTFIFLSNYKGTVSGGSIAGTVYNDANGNKLKDAGEVGVANITVYNDANNNSKLDAGELKTITDVGGAYLFSGLSSGAYKIRQILQTGWSQTTPINNYGWTITLASNQNLTAKNFGTKQSGATPPPPAGASISGTIFNDLDGDGVKDSNEIGVGSSWKVYIDLDNDSILDTNEVFTTTDANGNWTLSGLAAGTYKVRQVLQTGWAQTTPTKNYGLNVTLTSNQSVIGKLFGAKKIA